MVQLTIRRCVGNLWHWQASLESWAYERGHMMAYFDVEVVGTVFHVNRFGPERSDQGVAIVCS